MQHKASSVTEHESNYYSQMAQMVDKQGFQHVQAYADKIYTNCSFPKD